PGISYVDGAYWSLTVELTFYIIMGFLLYTGLTNKIVTVSIAWLILSSVIMIITNLIDNSIMNFIEFISISKYSHLFIAGIMFYLIKENAKIIHHIIIFLCLLYEFIFVDGLINNIFI